MMQDEMLRGEIAQRHARACAQRMPGRADQHHLIDDGLGLEQAFNARRINLLAIGGNDQLFLTAGDIDITVGVDFGDIAGV